MAFTSIRFLVLFLAHRSLHACIIRLIHSLLFNGAPTRDLEDLPVNLDAKCLEYRPGVLCDALESFRSQSKDRRAGPREADTQQSWVRCGGDFACDLGKTRDLERERQSQRKPCITKGERSVTNSLR